jgi:CBS domain containing-hemolysin-like protein
MGLLIFYILLALGVSFLCSVMEAVLLSVTPSYIAMIEQEGKHYAKTLKQYKDDVDQPLAAILSLNTIAHTIGAAGAGAQAAKVFGDTSIAIFSAVLTLLILILSEIIPKSLGALYWQSLTPTIVRLLRPLIFLLWPLVKVSQAITALLAKGHHGNTISREELSAMADLVGQAGAIEETESQIMKNLLRFGSLRAKDVMTPRPVLFTCQQDTTVGEVLEQHDGLNFSRIPIYTEIRDDINSFVLKDDILLQAAQGSRDTPLKELKRAFLIVPETQPLLALFDQLVKEAQHIALVVGEYGGVSGVVTMEDVVETMLGMEIVDEADNVADMQELARQQWRKRAKRLGLDMEKLDPATEANEDLRKDKPEETKEATDTTTDTTNTDKA